MWSKACSLPPLSSFVFFGAIVGCFKKGNGFLVWTPFLHCVFHSYISNRDRRLLFPVLPIVPNLVVFGCSHLFLNFKSNFWNRMIQFSICKNWMALMWVSTLSACSVIPFYSYLYKSSLKDLDPYPLNSDPYERVGLNLNYYKPAHDHPIWKSSIQEIQEILSTATLAILFFWFQPKFDGSNLRTPGVCRKQFRIFQK